MLQYGIRTKRQLPYSGLDLFPRKGSSPHSRRRPATGFHRAMRKKRLVCVLEKLKGAAIIARQLDPRGSLSVASKPEAVRKMWVFGYGSLMWDGWEDALGGSRVDRAALVNYRRSFNKKSTRNWGTAEVPGPTLGLEAVDGMLCIGTAFEFPDDLRPAIETLLKKREGPSFTFPELPVRLPDGREIRALTPVNNRSSGTYIGNVPARERATMARAATGEDGACADYVRNIAEKLRALEIADEDVEDFARLVDAD
ncbi:MAG: gamma-glutamylcyclotransferase [Candidatus Solibacter sp.]